MPKKSICSILFFALIALLFTPKTSSATHIAGADWHYECVGPNTYLITLSLFRACEAQLVLGNAQSIFFTSPCGNLPNINLPLQSTTEVSQLCAAEMANSDCNGGPLPGMQQYIYEGLVVFPNTCDSWTIGWKSCCRNQSILNLVNPLGTGLAVVTTLNSATDSCNNSPVFNAQPIPYVCLNQLVNYNFGVIESDGDSVVYSMADPIDDVLAGAITNVTFVNGYSIAQPLPGAVLNTATGQLVFTPTIAGNFVVSVQACEYEYGTGILLGCVSRDIQFVVMSCSNHSPLVEGFKNFSGTGILVDSTTIEVCVGNTFSFDIEYPDPDTLDTVSLYSNITSVLPGAILSYTSGNPGIMSVTWTTTSGTPPFNTFSVTGVDDACPLFGLASASFVIKVTPSTYAGPDQTICQGSQWAHISATGGSVFNWSLLSGSAIDTVPTSPGFNMTCQNCTSPSVSPQVTSTYLVTSNLSTTCHNTDTITIIAAPDYIPFSGPDTVTCSVDSLQLFAGASIGGVFTYRWDNIPRLSSDTVQNPLAQSPITATYNVTMTSPDGCIKTASNTVGKVPPIPIPTIEATPGNICQFGDSTQLNLDLGANFQTTCTAAYSPCGNLGYTTDILLDYNISDGTSGPLVTMANSPSAGNPVFPAPFSHSYKSVKQQYLYQAAELTAMGLQSGLITEIGFFVTALHGITTYSGYNIKMGCTSYNSMPGTIFPTGLVDVFPTQNVSPALGWNMMTFTTPYVWDGASNIIIEICYDNRSQGATTLTTLTRTREYKATTPGSQKRLTSLHIGIDTANACNSQLGVSTSFTRPDTRFTFCYGYNPAAYNYTWWPNKDISNTTIQAPQAWPDTTTTYNVILADTFGVCSDTTSIEISVANFDAGPDTIICAGDTIQLSPEVFDQCTGNPPFVYWYTNTGIGLVGINGITPTVSVDTTTTFFVTYTNFCGCIVDDSITVFVNKMYNPNLIFTEPSCGLSDGQVLVNNNGGSAPFLFSIDGGQSFQIDSLFTSLAMGPYTTQYMDSNGCLSPLRTDTLINFNTPIIDSVITNTPLCFSTANGIIDIYFNGGQGPHSFSLDNGVTWSPNSSYTNISAGTYIVLAQDANGCISWPDTVTLVSNNQLLFDSLQYTDLNCFNDSSGTINVFGHGGTSPYTYSIDGGLNYQNLHMFDTLDADTFTIVIMDSVGCTTIPVQQIIVNAPEMIANFTSINDTCFNACGGSSSVTITGGTLPFTFSWRKGINPIGLNSPTIDGLCAGTDYELTTSDANNCSQTFPFVITHPDEIIASAISTNTSCFGIDDGKLDLSATGGVPPYSYSINNGATFSTNQSFIGLAAGTYSIMVADSFMRCFGTTTAIIEQPQEIKLTTNISDLQICISACVPLIATATGGVDGTYNYLWNQGFDSNGAQTACPTQTTIYTVYAIDSLGCTSSPKLITLKLFDSLEVDAGLDAQICSSQGIELNALAIGGNGQGITYQWVPASGLSNAFIQNPVATPSVSTLYTVKVTDNCETPPAFDTVRVNLHPKPTIDFFTNDSASGCEPYNISLINASMPVQTAEWTVSNDEISFGAHGLQVDLTDLTAGLYNVKLTVITPNGCTSEITKENFFEVFPKPTALFEMDPSQTTVFNTTVQFEEKSIGAVQVWQWDFANIANSTEQHPFYQFPNDTGTFPITLHVITDQLCEDDVTELLRIGGEYNMYIPNSFTPNGDGQNDLFAPTGLDLDPSQYSLQIYDRWGGLVFESTDLYQPWDGRHQGTSTMAQNGIYVWKVIAHDTTFNPEYHEYNGTINLIR